MADLLSECSFDRSLDGFVDGIPSFDGIAWIDASMAYSSVLTLRRSPHALFDAAFYRTMESTWILNCRH
jgi:hypothetical protein